MVLQKWKKNPHSQSNDKFNRPNHVNWWRRIFLSIIFVWDVDNWMRSDCENVQPHVNFGHGFNLLLFFNANKLKSHGTNCHVLLQGLLIWLETVHPLAYVPLDVMPISHLLKAISDMHLSTFCTNVHYGKSTPLEEEVLHIHPKVPLCDRPSCTYYYHNYWNVIHKFKSTIEWGRSAIERRMKRTSSIEVQIPRKVKGQKGGERGGGGIWIFIC